MNAQPSGSAAAELQQLLALPPANFGGNAHGNNAAAIAHAALQALRDSGDGRFLFLRTILELQQDAHRQEELLFHCVTCCRHVVLHKWNDSSVDYRECVRDFFMSWGLQASLPRTIQLACYSSAVSFWKRQWNESNPENGSAVRPEEQALVDSMRHQLPSMVALRTKEDLFYFIESLLQPSIPQQMASACTFLSVMVGEFAGKSAVQYHLPLEFHKRAHGAFERDGWLETCLKLGMGALSHVVGAVSENPSNVDQQVAMPVVQLTTDVIGWEFGTEAWEGRFLHTSSRTLVRPPATWNDYLIRPNFVAAIFYVHECVKQTHAKLAHVLRQLLLLLASLSGPILADAMERKDFAAYLMDGVLKLLSVSNTTQIDDTSELVDVLSIMSRVIANFKLATLVQLPAMAPLLNAMASIGTSLLQSNVAECESVQGDVELMEHREAREEALSLLLEGAVLLCGDPWLFYSSNEQTKSMAHQILSTALSPLYNAFVTFRIHMAKLEEHYLTAHATELDEVREDISALDLEEEMTSVAVIGRLSLVDALNHLSSLFQRAALQLQSMWNLPGHGDVTPEGAACLEVIRLLTRSLGHLLTDDNTGETPVIPESIVMACQSNDAVAIAISSSVQAILSLAELQASKISQNPSDPRLSPLLAASFLWFLNRWAPAYIYPVEYGSTDDGTRIRLISLWAQGDSAQKVVSFCATVCLHYQCYWPQERQVQEGSHSLILALAKRGTQIRSLLVVSPAFAQIVTFHCLTAGMRHNAPSSELEALVRQKVGGSVSLEMVQGYQRLRYDDRSRLLTCLLVATCDTQNETATAMFNECQSAVHSAFSSLVQALNSKQVRPDDVNAQEMACLCVEMYGGVARAGDMNDPERVVQFITPSLPHLSGLMTYYADFLTICEGLLRLFRDYAEQFVALLDREQSLTLFNASAELLKSYSSQHVASRVVTRAVATSVEADAEEEQNYSDVLCAIELLINLGAKDFIDICTSTTAQGVDSSQVTDIIFFGLQQIIPLMTQGLLQFPTLCTQYFSLVGFMMDTYPEKVCILPFELFDSLLESLLFGMSHLDTFVSKSSLQGIASLTREHLKTKSLAPHLAQHPDIFDKCTRRLLQDVAFQSIVWDRLEPCGMALLPLAAVDPQRFVAVVNVLTQQVPSEQQRTRLHGAFEKLINVDVLEKVSNGGYEGRMNRMRFKKDFETFVKEVHSFLVVK